MKLLKKLYILFLFCLLSVPLSAEREAITPQEKELIEAVSENFVTLAERLISEGVAVDITDDYGQSLLMFASQNSNQELVRLLVNKGADPNYQINQKASYNQDRSAIKMLFLNRLTVLDYAVKSNNITMVDLLLELGAKLDVDNKDLGSTVANASKNRNVKMVTYLLSKGAKVSDETGQALVVWHIARAADPIYGRAKITKDTDFTIIKIWDNYGVPLDDEVLTSSQMLRKPRDKQNVINYMEAYRAWVASGAKLSQETIRQQEEKPIPRTIDEAEMDSIISAAQHRADNYVPPVSGREELEIRRDKILNWVIGFVVVALMIVIVFQRKPIILFLKTYFNKQNTPPPFSSPNLGSPQSSNVRPVEQPIEVESQVRKVSKGKKKQRHISITEIGWIDDDTIGIEVNYLTIEDMINPIRLRNEHERAVREMIWYIRKIEKLSDKEIVDALGIKGLQPKLEELRISIKSTNVRDVYKRSLYILVKHYSKRDKKVQAFLKKTQWVN